MHRCTSTSSAHHCNPMGPCTCNLFHISSSFDQYHPSNPYPMASSSSVDCTLSLGTPSTRQSNDIKRKSSSSSSSSSFMSNICGWGAFQTKQTHKSNRGSSSSNSNSNGNGGGNVNMNMNGDPLVPRRCANCDTTSTPLWRNGPKGPKSLCNACGIRYKKEERRATNTSTVAAAAPTIIDSQHLMGHHNLHHHAWAHHHHHQTSSLGNEFRFIDDNENNVPFLSWRLNVPVHDYT